MGLAHLNILHSFLKRLPKHGIARGDGRRLDNLTMVDGTWGGRGRVVLETPGTISKECRVFVYQTDVAKF